MRYYWESVAGVMEKGMNKEARSEHNFRVAWWIYTKAVICGCLQNPEKLTMMEAINTVRLRVQENHDRIFRNVLGNAGKQNLGGIEV